ncbi:MAG: hypothetical protein I3274_05885 [Candidatus Moeniiplasma glomeromycotorum]|nr:hypothetical protein [Candidatus Moeniiplasma glomeromycotorum]
MVDPITNAYPIFYNSQKITTFYYPKEKALDPNFDIKENFKFFYNKNSNLIRIQLGEQSFTFSSQQIIGNDKSLKIYEEIYEDETYKNKKSTLFKEIKLPSSLSAWEEIN